MMTMGRRNWTREELIIACNLYCKLRFGQLHAKNPRVAELAQFLRRTPGSVAMKLVNFASLDPTHQQRGVSGLTNTSRADRQVWDEFNCNWPELAAESETAYRQLLGISATPDENSAFAQDETERQRVVMVRMGQAFFRETVLASYGSRCCVCELPVPPLLVASHIVPWAIRPELRINPRNGLCLCVLHDKAFDRGLLAVDGGLRLIVSKQLEAYLPGHVIEQMFIEYSGHCIGLPEKFRPHEDFLAYHRDRIFMPM